MKHNTTLKWDDTTLVLDPEISTGTIARRTLSVSSAKTLASCPARFAASKINPDHPSLMDASVIGNAGHDVLEHLMRGAPEARTRDWLEEILDNFFDPAIDAANLFAEYPSLHDDYVREEFRQKVRDGIIGYFDIEDPSTVNVFACEYEIKDAHIEGVPFGGFIDRVDEIVDKDGNKALRVIDYKTGKMPSPADLANYGDPHSDQIRLYAIALEEITGLKVKEGFVYYTSSKNRKKRRVALSKAYRKASAKAHQGMWELHNSLTSSGRFPTSASGLCSYCPLVRSCPGRASYVKWEIVEQKEAAREAAHGPSQPQKAPEASTVHAEHSEDSQSLPGCWQGPVHDVVSDPSSKEITVQYFEAKQWENDPKNLASYAHLSASTLTLKALHQIRRSGLPLQFLSAELIEASAEVLTETVLDVQERFLGTRELHAALSRNLCYALDEMLEIDPMPIVVENRLATAEEMEQWRLNMASRLTCLVQVGIHLVEDADLRESARRFQGGSAVHQRAEHTPVPAFAQR